MTTPTVKVGDTIRMVEPWAVIDGATYYMNVTIETPEAAARMVDRVAAGKWIVLSTNNERKDDDADC